MDQRKIPCFLIPKFCFLEEQIPIFRYRFLKPISVFLNTEIPRSVINLLKTHGRNKKREENTRRNGT